MASGGNFGAPGEVSLLPPGHDAWVVGNDPTVVVINFPSWSNTPRRTRINIRLEIAFAPGFDAKFFFSSSSVLYRNARCDETRTGVRIPANLPIGVSRNRLPERRRTFCAR